MIHDVTSSSGTGRGKGDGSYNLAHISELITLLRNMATAMGLPKTVFETKANGLYLTINEASSQHDMAQISLLRGIAVGQTPLLNLRWNVDSAEYLATKTIDDPIAPMSSMLAAITPNATGEYAVSEEQAMQIMYTMLKYLEVENRNSTGRRTGLPKTTIQTA